MQYRFKKDSYEIIQHAIQQPVFGKKEPNQYLDTYLSEKLFH